MSSGRKVHGSELVHVKIFRIHIEDHHIWSIMTEQDKISYLLGGVKFNYSKTLFAWPTKFLLSASPNYF